ncbi:MAG: tripartite tricarboxylate transporter TctB family protein [Hydrogenophaga sp.]|uniref:tripartite tricarboxylate transporter TctB family protein n=1 Tax=Hydrogenophaga sp. TaxID=1904254 RepID=UPI0025BE06B5|nr:tripartite tricarboxylate transporter TctB family protein [Hydrogenophaga sp.]MBU7571879.1 tripartite tricarboxylate transporter TctB family protein [Hydrogenophaga sp.]
MSEGGKTARSDLWGGAGWVVFGLAIVVGSVRMDRFESMGAQLYTMPGFVPGMIGCLVALLGLVLMARGWARRAQESAAPSEPLLNRRILVTLALTLVYAGLLIGRAPFWLVTALFVATFVALFAPANLAPARRATVAVLAGVLTSAVVTLVFEQVFLVRLP